MVDIVTNHMGYNGCGDCVDYSIYNPFNKQSYYHPFCLIDYSNQNSVEQVCSLSSRNNLQKTDLFSVLGWRQHSFPARLENRRLQCTLYVEYLDKAACIKLHQYVHEMSEAWTFANILQLMV